METDAAAAFAADDQQEQEAEQEAESAGEQPYITRLDAQGERVQFVILTKDQFGELFRFAFNAPQQLHPAFHHIAIDNGMPYRAEAAEATASRIYDLCRNSGVRWLENLLAVDQSGIQTVIELALVGWFAIGTLSGAGAAVRELRHGPPEATREAAEGQGEETGHHDPQNGSSGPGNASQSADEVPQWARKPAGGAA